MRESESERERERERANPPPLTPKKARRTAFWNTYIEGFKKIVDESLKCDELLASRSTAPHRQLLRLSHCCALMSACTGVGCQGRGRRDQCKKGLMEMEEEREEEAEQEEEEELEEDRGGDAR